MNTKIEINSEVRSTAGKDGAVLLDLRKGVYYSLNGLGTRIWTEIEQGSTFHEIVNHLAGSFAVSSEQLSHDVKKFILDLERKGLVCTSA